MLGERWLKTAYSYLYIRDFARATESFRRAIEADPTNPAYYFHASVTAFRNGNLELAHTWARAAVELEPTHIGYIEQHAVVESAILTRRAWEAEQQGDVEEALRSYQDALDRDPLNHEAEWAFVRLSEAKLEPHPGT